MYEFEEGLKKRLKKRIEDAIDKEFPWRVGSEDMSPDTRQILGDAQEELLGYAYEKKLEMENKSDDEEYELLDEIEKHFLSISRLKEAYEEKELTEEELKYIKYCYLLGRNGNYFIDCERYAKEEIAIRRLLFREFGEKGIQEIKETIEKRLKSANGRRELDDYKRFLAIVSDDPYNRQMLDQNIAAEMEKAVEKEFNIEINCGGYALRIDRCIFGSGYELDGGVSFLLENFPFVRLLGDGKLKEDEYMVIYKANGHGHHFIRVDDDGVVREKSSADAPKIFEGWDEDIFGEEMAVFAVKKDHQMYGHGGCVGSQDKKGLNFEQTVNSAIKSESNNFDYHGHEFFLKKSSDEEIYVVSNGEIVGYVLTGEDECLVEIADEKEDYVENFSGSIKPVIENGILQNWYEFYDRDPVESKDSKSLKASKNKDREEPQNPERER